MPVISGFSRPAPTLRFGSHLESDHGQSGVSGSMKVNLRAPDGTLVDRLEIKEIRPGGVKDAADYVAGVARHMAGLWKKNVANHQLPPNDQLESITITTAGAPDRHGVIPVIGGIRSNLNNEPLRQVNLGKLPEHLQQLGVQTHAALRQHTTVLNDMAGGAIQAYALIGNSLQPNSRFSYVMPGGGTGVAEIHRDDRHQEVVLAFTELGHFHPAGSGDSLETGGASATGLVRAFLNQLPLDEFIKKSLLERKPAEIVTSYTVARRNIPGLTRVQYQAAANCAVNGFLNALAQLAEISLLRGENALALAQTPVLKGVQAYLRRHQAEEPFKSELREAAELAASKSNHPGLTAVSGQSPVERILHARLWRRADAVGKGQFDASGYTIRLVAIRDNTQGTPFLRLGMPANQANTRFAIPLHVFSHA